MTQSMYVDAVNNVRGMDSGTVYMYIHLIYTCIRDMWVGGSFINHGCRTIRITAKPKTSERLIKSEGFIHYKRALKR